MKGYVFAAKWPDGTAEITITHNGTAEQRAGWDRGLGGPNRIIHGDVPRGGLMSNDEVIAYVCERFGVPVSAFKPAPIVGGVSFLKEATQ